MTFTEFERRARELFATIPPEFRGGVEDVVVSRRAVAHPELPDVYTLGECATGELDLDDGMLHPPRSEVRLFHGSFVALAQMEEEFDWEGELWETLTHEIRHHRESAAGEDALEDFDYAADENFKRREGRSFDPFFYRGGEPVEDGVWEVDGDVFAEVPLPRGPAAGDEAEVEIGGGRVAVPVPQEDADVCFLYLKGFGDESVDVAVVFVRRAGFWESLGSLFRRAEPEVAEWTLAPADWRRVPIAGEHGG